MLDWIFQIAGKAWATDEIVGRLVAAFDDLFQPQRNLCSGGRPSKINPTEHLRGLIFGRKGKFPSPSFGGS